MADEVTLETARLQLRPPRDSDLEPLHEIFSNPDAMAYWDSPPFAEISQTAQFLEMMQSSDYQTSAEFVIVNGQDVIGKAGLWRFPELGFILNSRFWGQGLATEAASAVIAYGFEQHHLPKIVCDVDPRNARSLRVLDKLGFVETGRAARTLLVGQTWVDSVYLALEHP